MIEDNFKGTYAKVILNYVFNMVEEKGKLSEGLDLKTIFTRNPSTTKTLNNVDIRGIGIV